MQIDPTQCAVTDAAILLGLDRRSIQRWRKDGAPWNDDGTVSIAALYKLRVTEEEGVDALRVGRPERVNDFETAASRI